MQDNDLQTPADVLAVAREAELLFTPLAVTKAIDQMALDIHAVFAEKNPIVLCLMIGGLVFAGQLLVRLSFPLQLDYLHLSRYRGSTEGGTLRLLQEPSVSLRSRHVLLLDDVLDQGVTLSAAVDYCGSQQALSVQTAVLISKDSTRCADGLKRANFTGLTLTGSDRYLFGSGMDYHGYLRNAAGIYALRSA